jgi:Domain of unknown function (DUF4190)
MAPGAETCASCGAAAGATTGTAVPAPQAVVASTEVGTNKKAIWSLVSGIIGLFIFGIGLGPAAIVLSFQARKEIDESGEKGQGLATAGAVVGVLAVLGYVWVRFFLVQ